MTLSTTRPAPARDTRLDLLRGWLQLQIFASHAHGSLIGAWLISAAWGFSDSSEQFVYLSGFALGSVFTLKAHRGGCGPRAARPAAAHPAPVGHASGRRLRHGGDGDRGRR